MIKILDTKNLILSPMQGAGVGDDFFMSPQPNWKMMAEIQKKYSKYKKSKFTKGRVQKKKKKISDFSEI